MTTITLNMDAIVYGALAAPVIALVIIGIAYLVIASRCGKR